MAMATKVSRSAGLTPYNTPRSARVRGDGGGNAEGDADDREREPLPEHQLRNVGGLRAEGRAHADLTSALRDAVGDDAVEADRGEHERDDRERREQRRRKARC